MSGRGMLWPSPLAACPLRLPGPPESAVCESLAPGTPRCLNFSLGRLSLQVLTQYRNASGYRSPDTRSPRPLLSSRRPGLRLGSCHDAILLPQIPFRRDLFSPLRGPTPLQSLAPSPTLLPVALWAKLSLESLPCCHLSLSIALIILLINFLPPTTHFCVLFYLTGETLELHSDGSILIRIY